MNQMIKLRGLRRYTSEHWVVLEEDKCNFTVRRQFKPYDIAKIDKIHQGLFEWIIGSKTYHCRNTWYYNGNYLVDIAKQKQIEEQKANEGLSERDIQSIGILLGCIGFVAVPCFLFWLFFW